VIHGLGQCLGASATAHVGAVDGVSVFERELRHAAHVAGVRRTLQAVDHYNLAQGFAFRALGVDQNLHVQLGGVMTGFDGETLLIEASLGEVARNGEQVRVPDYGVERVHCFSLRGGIAYIL